MDDVFVLEAADHMNDSVHLTDMGQELVAQAFALAGPLDQTGDIHKLNGGGSNLFGVIHIRQYVQTAVRHRHNAGVRLDGAEGVIGSLCARAGDGVKQSALSYVGETYDTKFQCVHFLSTDYLQQVV